MNFNFKENARILSWALYDLANQFFALNIISLYFVRWLVLTLGVPEIFYSIAFAVSVFFTALLSPVLGAVSDRAQRHRFFLIIFTLLSVLFTMCLGWTRSAVIALVFFGIANLGCQLAAVFYNALMANITAPGKVGVISGFGKMCGYMGAAISLYFFKPIVEAGGYQAAFIPTGILFFVFALPCMLFVKDKEPQKLDPASFLQKETMRQTYQSLKETFWMICRDRGMFSFLLSVFFSMAAVNAVILFMSVYASNVFNLDESQIVHLIAFAVVFSISGSVISGWLSDRFGYRRCLFCVYGLWVMGFTAGGLASGDALYRPVGALIGLALGATWVVVRAMAIHLVPQERIGEIFGLFNTVGYGAAITGALFWGFMVFVTGPLGEWSYRLALLSLNIFMGLGIYFLKRVPLK